MRIKADIENEGIARKLCGHVEKKVFTDQAEGATGLIHRYRSPIHLGGKHPFVHTGLHHRDTNRDFDGLGRAGGTGNDTALNADPRDNLAVAGCVGNRAPYA